MNPNQPIQYYLLMEDLASALIGPFPDLPALNDHLAFMRGRGGGAVVKGIYDSTNCDPFTPHLRLTPEMDRKINALTL